MTSARLTRWNFCCNASKYLGRGRIARSLSCAWSWRVSMSDRCVSQCIQDVVTVQILCMILSSFVDMGVEVPALHVRQERQQPIIRNAVEICAPCGIHAKGGGTYIQMHIQMQSHIELRLTVRWPRNLLHRIRCRRPLDIRLSRCLAQDSMPPSRCSPMHRDRAQRHDVAGVQQGCWRLQLSRVLRIVARAYVQDQV
jgi:hypothetical protein